MSHYDDDYMYYNTQPKFEDQFMKRLSNIEAEFKKALIMKKPCILIPFFNLSIFDYVSSDAAYQFYL